MCLGAPLSSMAALEDVAASGDMEGAAPACLLTFVLDAATSQAPASCGAGSAPGDELLDKAVLHSLPGGGEEAASEEGLLIATGVATDAASS